MLHVFLVIFYRFKVEALMELGNTIQLPPICPSEVSNSVL
jgi:hypothetical protein